MGRAQLGPVENMQRAVGLFMGVWKLHPVVSL